MSALKEGIAYLRDAISRNGKCAAVPADMVLALWEDVSDRLDAIDEMEKKQNTINSSILDVLDMLKQKAHKHDWLHPDMSSFDKPVAQDERSCSNCGAGHMECHTDGVRPYCDEWQPKEQEQGGKDKKVSGCFYDHESCDVVDDLRARLALLEKENAELKRTCEVLEAGQCIGDRCGAYMLFKDKSEVKG